MNSTKNLFIKCIILISIFVIMCSALQADELIMTTGERFTSEQIWEEGDKIKFNMQGIVVSVKKSDIAQIIKENKASDPVLPNTINAMPSPAQVPRNDTTPARNLDIRPTPTDPTASQNPPYTRLHSDRVPNSSINRTRRANTNFAKSEVHGTGIDGFTWRMPIKQLSGMEKVETDPAFGGIDQYYRVDHPLKFAGVALDGMVYGFWENQLYSIMMWTEGRISYTQLKRGLFSVYGRGIQRKPEVERFVWDEQDTQRMLEFDDKLKTGIFIMRSSELDEVIKKRYPASSNR